MTPFEWILFVVGCLSILAYKCASLPVWTFVSFILLYVISRVSGLSGFPLVFLWGSAILLAVFLNVRSIRKMFFTRHILALFRKNQPRISTTEKEALEAGTVVWDRDLFSGQPSWEKLCAQHMTHLTEDEKAFLSGPTEELCDMAVEWELASDRVNLPESMWNFIKSNGFLALAMPVFHGGKGFSAYATACIIAKISGKSPTLSSVVSVPNSLGPGELILEYGTLQQQNYYLPRLAKGEDIPCFALTGPDVGSDAGALPDKGIVCKGTYEGREIIGMRLNWNKRYITLAPVATLLGLAFKLHDPEHLLGDVEDIGITCALIPTNLPGITIGRRHFAGALCFINGPNQGKDVFVPLDNIIGGPQMAGRGWQMLVECLSSGRAISLPGGVLGGMKAVFAATSAYSRIRRQFNQPIAKFEAIKERLARMGASVYMSDAVTHLTASYVDQGEKPAILSAIAKYHTTEFSRKLTHDSMDVHAGKGICMGPRNYLSSFYASAPIPITVEGSNILVRCLIIFGQGAVRCHPYLYQEMSAAENPDEAAGLESFDQAVFAHLGLTISNCVRVFVLAFANVFLYPFPAKNKAKREFQLFSRYSAVLAFLTDMSLFLLQDKLKRREKISARLADILGMLYVGSAVLRKYQEQGSPEEDWPLIKWCCDYLRYMIQEQANNTIDNLSNATIRKIFSFLVFPLGRRDKFPQDKLTHQVSELLTTPTATRTRLLKGLHSPESGDPLSALEKTFLAAVKLEPMLKKLRKMPSTSEMPATDFASQVAEGVKQGIFTEETAKELTEMMDEVNDIIAVDDFDAKNFHNILKPKNVSTAK